MATVGDRSLVPHQQVAENDILVLIAIGEPWWQL